MYEELVQEILSRSVETSEDQERLEEYVVDSLVTIEARRLAEGDEVSSLDGVALARLVYGKAREDLRDWSSNDERPSIEQLVLHHFDALDSFLWPASNRLEPAQPDELTVASSGTPRGTLDKTVVKNASAEVRNLLGLIAQLRAPIWITERLREDMDSARKQKVDEVSARIQQSEQTAGEIDSKVKTIASQVDAIKSDFKTEMEKSLKDLEKEYITILSILIAVVLAFNAGITFTADGIDAAKSMNPFSVGLVVAIVGLVLFNTVFVLFSFLNHLLGADPEQWGFLKREVLASVNVLLVGALLCFGSCAYWTSGFVSDCVSGGLAIVVLLVGFVLVGRGVLHLPRKK